MQKNTFFKVSLESDFFKKQLGILVLIAVFLLGINTKVTAQAKTIFSQNFQSTTKSLPTDLSPTGSTTSNTTPMTLKTSNEKFIIGEISKFDEKWQKGGIFEGFTPSQEILEKRNRTTKQFKNTDGSYTAQIGGATHYKDKNGAWQDIDLSIKEGTTKKIDYKISNETNEIKSYFPEKAGTQNVIMKLNDNYELNWWQNPQMRFTVDGNILNEFVPKNVTAQISKSKIIYPEIYKGISEEFEVLQNGLENNIVVNSLTQEFSQLPPNANLEFSQFIPIQKGTQIKIGTEIKNTDFESDFLNISTPGFEDGLTFAPVIIFDNSLKKEDVLFLINAPVEKLTEEQRSKLENHILKGKYFVHFTNNGIQITVKLQASWLQASNRSFPVTIDPTVSIGTTTSSTGSGSPLTHWYGYQRHADLYLQSEVGSFGTITAIEYYKYGTEATRTKPTKVFLRTTSATTLTGTAAWNSSTYTGTGATAAFTTTTTQDNTAGWKMITLSTTFDYTANNLLVMVYDAYANGGSYQSMGNSTVTSRQAYIRQDITDPSDATATAVENRLPGIRITYTYLGCTNTYQFPTSAFTAPAPGVGSYQINTCNYAGDYNQMTTATAGNTFTSTSTGTGTIITVRAGTYNGSLVATGTSPLNWTATAGGTYFIHYNTNGLCGTASTCLTTDITNTSPAGPTVTNVSSSTANGTYKVGDVVTVSVTFSANVTVTGSPQILLETGTTDRQATYSSGSGTSVLSFTYTVQSGDVNADLDYQSTAALTLNGGTIKATSGGAVAILTLPTLGGAYSIAGQKAIVIDGVAPTVSIYSPSDGNTAVTVNQNLVLTFSENVQVGTAGNIVIYNSDNSVFETIPYNDSRITISTNTVTINPTGTFAISGCYYVQIASTAIRDIAGNAYAGISDATTWNFSTVGPTVTNVTSSTADGTYKVGDAVIVTITFSATVAVTGTPRIQLETGTTDQYATYSSGTGTNTLSFTYIVQTGDASADLNYLSTNSLGLNSGTINSTTTCAAAATLTLPALASANSLGTNKAIVIDGVAPTVSSYNPIDGSISVTANQNLILTFSENVQIGTGGTIIIYNSGGTTFESIPYNDSRITISGNTVTIDPSGTFASTSDYYVQISNTAITDIAGNAYAGISTSTTWNFTTVCGVISSLPWTEGFEGISSVGAGILPNCWSYANISGTNSPGSYGTNDTYREPRTGTKLMYTQYNTTAWVFTPSFALTAGTPYDFSFYMKNKSVTSPVDFVIDVAYGTSAVAGSMTTSLQSAYTANNSAWTLFTYTVTPGSSGNYNFGIKSTSTSLTPWYLSFDDFKLDFAPTPCVAPTVQPSSLVLTNQTSTSIDGSFTAVSPSPPSGYVVLRSTSSTAPTPVDATTYTAAGSPYTIGGNSYTAVTTSGTGPVTFSATGLTANTQYYFYVFSYNNTSCSGGPKYLTTTPLTGNSNTCPGAPTTLAVTGGTITASGATVTWSAPTGGAVALTYTVNYRINGASTWTTASISVTSTSYVITGLSASTTYDVQVIATNATCSGTAVSTNSLFTTTCAAITSLPWTENFDAMSSVGIGILPSCWQATFSAATQPWESSTGNGYNIPPSSPNYMTVYYYSSASTKYLMTPGFSLSSGTDYEFSFDWAGDFYTGWTGDVLTNTSQSSTGATLLGSFVTSGTTTPKTFANKAFIFTPSSTGTYYFLVRITNNSVPYYLSFDNFKVKVITCKPPTAITASTIGTTIATISWTAPTGTPPASYDIYYNTSGAAPTSGTTPSVTGVTTLAHILTGLTSTKLYYVWVRSNCGSGDVSTWVALPTFTTLDKSPIVGIPICYYDFESNSDRTTYENQVEQSINSGSTSLSTNGSTGTNANGAGLSQYSTGGGLVGLADGKAFAMYEGSSSSSTDPKAGATKYAQFSTSTSGFSGLMLTFDEMPNNIDAPYYGILYSTNGTNWYFVSSIGTPNANNNVPWSNGSWGKAYINLPEACDNQSTLYIRIYTYASSSSSPNAHLRIDNLMLLAQSTAAGKIFTTLDEGAIYTSFTAGATGFIWVRYNFNANGANTVMNLNDMAVDEDFTVTNGATVNFINGTTPTFLQDLNGGNFVLNSGCTIGISSVNGITASPTLFGNVQSTLLRSFSTGANYVYLGTSDQSTGDGLPSTVDNLIINKTNSTNKVTLTNSVSATTALTMTKGNIYTGANFVGIGTSTTSLGTLNYNRGSSGYVVGKMRRWFNTTTNSGDASGLYPLAQEVLGTLRNRYYLIEFTSAKTAGGSLDVNFNPQRMYFNGIPISGITTPSNPLCPSGLTFNVTTTADQGYWIATPSALTGGNYTLAITGQDLVTITEMCQLTLLKRVGAGPWLTPGVHLAPTGTTNMPTVSRSGLSGFSNFGFGGGEPNPLPVELALFNAVCEDGNGLIKWTTVSELNSKEFVLERSIDGGHSYEAIASIPGAGNSSSIINYSYTDNMVSSIQTYYRLKMVDIDGSFKNSVIITLNCENDKNEFTVYYTPEQGFVVKTELLVGSEYQIEVFEISGKRLMSEVKNLDKGSSVITLQTNKKLADGIYLIRINENNGTNIMTKKVLVK